MELKQFVSLTLQQIIAGVADAQAASGGENVNPKIWMAQRGDAAKMKILESNAGKWIHMVDFDVAVTAVESKETQGGVGVAIGVFALGSRGQSNAENSTVSRIKFQVPLSLPEKPAA